MIKFYFFSFLSISILAVNCRKFLDGGNDLALEAVAIQEEAQKYSAQGKNEQAIALFEKALKLYPNPALYYNYGNSLASLNRLKEAEEAYRQADGMQRDPERNRTLNPNLIVAPYLISYNRACIYSRLHDEYQTRLYLLEALHSGYPALAYLSTDPDLAWFRTLPVWQENIRAFTERPSLALSDIVGRYFPSGAAPGGYEAFCSNGTYVSWFYHEGLPDDRPRGCPLLKRGSFTFSGNLITVGLTEKCTCRPNEVPTCEPLAQTIEYWTMLPLRSELENNPNSAIVIAMMVYRFDLTAPEDHLCNIRYKPHSREEFFVDNSR